jgi:uncharacterized protein (TIGR01777 family)
MQIIVTGGTGFIGPGLIWRLTEIGHGVTVVSRRDQNVIGLPNHVDFVQGDPAQEGEWQESAAQADAAINLAGASIFQRWSEKTKRRIYDSRILTTRNLVNALASGNGTGRVLLNASAVGYYGFHDDEQITEDSPPGNDFLASVCRSWENEAIKAEKAGVRVCRMRFGVVLEEGGALGKMLPMFKMGLGGRLGSGNQWFSWIHRTDLIEAAMFLLGREDAKGAFNLTAPNPVTNRQLTRELGGGLHRPTILPAPGFAMKMILGEFANVLLKGQRVIPSRLLDMGFAFTFPNLKQALWDIIDKNKS